MSGNLSVEELVIDDSFSNYCFQKNEGDILYWEEYFLANPSERGREFTGCESVTRWFDLIRTGTIAKATLNQAASEVPVKTQLRCPHTDYWVSFPVLK